MQIGGGGRGGVGCRGDWGEGGGGVTSRRIPSFPSDGCWAADSELQQRRAAFNANRSEPRLRVGGGGRDGGEECARSLALSLA